MSFWSHIIYSAPEVHSSLAGRSAKEDFGDNTYASLQITVPLSPLRRSFLQICEGLLLIYTNPCSAISPTILSTFTYIYKGFKQLTCCRCAHILQPKTNFNKMFQTNNHKILLYSFTQITSVPQVDESQWKNMDIEILLHRRKNIQYAP